MYVEENEDSGFMLSTLLGFSEIDVVVVNSVKEGFQSAQNKNFDLYLLSSRFSDGSGLELCQKLRELEPQTPIVFYSGEAYDFDIQMGLVAGANKYLIKPNAETVAPTIFQLVRQDSKVLNN